MTNTSSDVLETTDTDLSVLPEEFKRELKKKVEIINDISLAFQKNLIIVDMATAKIFTQILNQNYQEVRALFEKTIKPIAKPDEVFDDSCIIDIRQPLRILANNGEYARATPLLSNKLRIMINNLNSVEPIVSVHLPIHIRPQMPKAHEAFASLREGFSTLAHACTL